MKTKRVLVSLALSLSLLVVLGLVLIGASQAAPAVPQADLHVCASGCPYSSTQAAVDAANSGDVIKVATGTYTGVFTRSKCGTDGLWWGVPEL